MKSWMESALEARDAGLQGLGEAAALSGGQEVDDESGEHRLDERGLQRGRLGVHPLSHEALLDVRPPRRDLFGPHRAGQAADGGVERGRLDPEPDRGEVGG